MTYMLSPKKQSCCSRSHGNLPCRGYQRFVTPYALQSPTKVQEGGHSLQLQFLVLQVCNIVDLASQIKDVSYVSRGGTGGTLGMFGWGCGCAAGIAEPLTYTRICSTAIALYYIRQRKISGLSQTNYEPEPLTFTALINFYTLFQIKLLVSPYPYPTYMAVPLPSGSPGVKSK